jgi:hypothetical protein
MRRARSASAAADVGGQEFPDIGAYGNVRVV